MNEKFIILNASNLHGGGAVQVAVSLISELGHLSVKEKMILVLSSAVVRECERNGANLNSFHSMHEINVFGLTFFHGKICKIFSEADVVFTVFGPLYLNCRVKKSIVGFAQPWILYPFSEAFGALPASKRVLVRLKYAVQRYFFRAHSDMLIVEAEHARKRLAYLFPKLPVAEVPNALNGVFLDALPIAEGDARSKMFAVASKSEKHIILGHVGRAYSHKNLAILPAVQQNLWERYRVKATIRTTLNQTEWAAQTEEFRSKIENVGPLSLQECVSFYQDIDGVIFPSLLECFSAAPLEAMAMRLPLFASDRNFVRDFCQDIPFYFDPLDPCSIADAIMQCVDMPPEALASRLERGVQHILNRPTAKGRALRISEILTSFSQRD